MYNQLDYHYYPILAPTVLTTSYVPYELQLTDPNSGAVIQSLLQNDQLIIYGFLTLGSLTSMNLKVEFSNDNSTWVQETLDFVGSASTGVINEYPFVRNIAQSGNFRIPIRIRDQYIRISVEGVGTVTGSTFGFGVIVGTDI